MTAKIPMSCCFSCPDPEYGCNFGVAERLQERKPQGRPPPRPNSDSLFDLARSCACWELATGWCTSARCNTLPKNALADSLTSKCWRALGTGHGDSQRNSGGTKRATSTNMPPLRLQSSEGKFTMSLEIETVVLLQAQKLHVYGSGTLGAFWEMMTGQDLGQLTDLRASTHARNASASGAVLCVAAALAGGLRGRHWRAAGAQIGTSLTKSSDEHASRQAIRYI